MSETPIAIGKANIDGFQRKKSFKLEAKKANEYRILPPLGKLAAKGQWDNGVAVHWGYSTSGGKMRPFQCVEVIKWGPNKTKEIVVECPRCKKTAAADLVYKQNDAKLKAAGVPDETRLFKLKPLHEYIQRFNRSFRYFANAMNGSGEIGRLDYSARHRKLLVSLLKELEKQGLDAFAPETGVFFNFFYEGQDGHKVDVVRVPGNQPGTFTLKMGPLTPAIISRLGNESHDLTDLFPVITPAQVQALVENENSPDLGKLVDSIFESSKSETQATTATSFGDTEPDLGEFGGAAIAATVAQPSPSFDFPVQTTAPAAPAPVQVAPAIAAATPAQASAAISGMTDGDFENLFNK